MDYMEFYHRHVQGLEKVGNHYQGWCPFHEDHGSRHKGFCVNPDNGLWNCFSCRKGGNAYTFCKKMGIPVDQAPDHDPNYEIYGYTGGVFKLKPKREGGDEKQVCWRGPDKGRNRTPYNPLAADWALELRRTLWICEGESSTRAMLEAGEQALGIPSASSDHVLEGFSLTGIPEVIIACSNNEEGEAAA